MQPSTPGSRHPGVQSAGETKAATTDRDADFTAYLEARQSRLMGVAYLLTGDRHSAEDLLQTSLAKLYLAWDNVRDRDNVDAYVRRIMVNENNSLWRRAWKRREVTTDEVPDRTPVHDQHDEGVGAAVWDIVQTLPRRSRAVVVLRYYEQLSERETADLLGVTVGTVKSQCSRALAALRERTPSDLDPTTRYDDREGER